MAKLIFRKAALEKLASPDQLDYMMHVTSPKGWMALFGLALLLGSGGLWGVYGTVPTRVAGNGILIVQGGLHEIVSISEGQVMEIFLKTGDNVLKGQKIARIESFALLEQIKKARAELESLKVDYHRLVLLDAEQINLQKRDFKAQRSVLSHKIDNDRKFLEILKERFKNQKKLYEDGLLTRQAVLNTRQNINETELAIEENQEKLKTIDIREFQVSADKKRQHLQKQEDITQKEKALDVLKDTLEHDSTVISPYAGTVLETLNEKSDFIRKGDRLITLESVQASNKDLEALLFISPMDGKKVKPGMVVHISPTTVQQEEYGFMYGKVADVSKFPATKKNMMHILKNEALVADFSKQGDPFQIDVSLTPDPGTESGFRWSSPKGPPVRISSGTVCSSKITVEEQPPINLVIPMLKKTFLGTGEL